MLSLVTLIVIVLVIVGCVLVQKYAHTDDGGKIRYEPAPKRGFAQSIRKTVEQFCLSMLVPTGQKVLIFGAVLDVNGGVYEYDFPNPDDCFWKEPPGWKMRPRLFELWKR